MNDAIPMPMNGRLHKTTRKASPKPQQRPTFDARFKVGMTVGLGCGIPLLSLALSSASGTLATAGLWPLALFAFLLMISVLAVSLPHLAWSISDVTRSKPFPAWSLAVALDLSLVLVEFCRVWAPDIGLDLLLWTVMGAVCIASMLLNCWAFFRGE